MGGLWLIGSGCSFRACLISDASEDLLYGLYCSRRGLCMLFQLQSDQHELSASQDVGLCSLALPRPAWTSLWCFQIQWDYLKGKILLSYSKELEMQLSVLVMLQHWAKTEQESSVPSRYA